MIRKISIGGDYKSGAMHYIAGQSVLGDHVIHQIKYDTETNSHKIYIIDSENMIRLWKEFTSTMPVSLEYNIDY